MDLIGYIRVSTEDQAENGHSLPLVQPQALEAIAARLGGRLVHVIVDGEGSGDDFRGISGSLPLARRRGGAELLTRLRAGEAQGVVAYSLERMFRNVDDGRAFFQRYGIKRGVQVTTVTEGTLDPSTVSGWLLINNLLLFGEIERMRAGERTRYAVQAMRAAGKVHGTTPYGCVAVAGRLFRDRETWELRELIVRHRLEGLPYQGLSDLLRKLRIPAPGGGARWSKSALQRICSTHESLAHLPVADQPATATTAARDAAASPESQL
jgi:DNA invertase Pin-like site-specific DNA recombinase